MSAAALAFSGPRLDPPFRLAETDFDSLVGFGEDDLVASWRVLQRSARAIACGLTPLRAAVEPEAWISGVRRLAALAEPADRAAAQTLFRCHFTPYRIESADPATRGFLTGYYEPAVPGSLARTPAFIAPVLARPEAYARLGPGVAAEPYPERAAIEAAAERGEGRPVAWLSDWVEVFLVQVQGSARVVLPDGSALRLVYDGRNGQPYTSIGRILVKEGAIPLEAMSLERLKGWIRANGQEPGAAGRVLMQRNRSYIFFRSAPATTGEGPIGGQGLPLEALRSIAVDRTIWPYGLPFWIEADLPWRSATPSAFRRLMVAQDTGSAILGPARADIFFGSGETAGTGAGGIRHAADFTVLLPRDVAPRGVAP